MLREIEHDAVLELRLERPPANALSPELIDRLSSALDAAVLERDAVVLSGLPGMFSAGLDVPGLLGRGRAEIRALWDGFLALLQRLADCPVPVAAAITGHSPAGGAVMALFCDERVMAEGDFKIGLNEVQVGISLPTALLAPLSRLIGERQAERLGVGGLMVGSAEALALGLVDELAPPDEVVPRALERLRRLLALPRPAMLSTRRTFRRGLGEALDREELVADLVEQWFSEPTQRALTALVERLKAR